jgi:hypothetical protein
MGLLGRLPFGKYIQELEELASSKWQKVIKDIILNLKFQKNVQSKFEFVTLALRLEKY